MSRKKLTGLGIGLGLMAAGMLMLAGLMMFPGSRLPNVFLGEVHFHGLDRVRAEAVLADRLEDFQTVSITVADREKTWTLAELGLAIDRGATLDRLFGVHTSANRLTAARTRAASWFYPIVVEAVVRVDETVFSAARENFLATTNQPARDASLLYEAGVWQVLPSVVGSGIEDTLLVSAILNKVSELASEPIHLTPTILKPIIETAVAASLVPQAERATAEPLLLSGGQQSIVVEPAKLATWLELNLSTGEAKNPVLTVNQTKIQAFAKALAETLNEEAIDARVAFQNGAVVITQESRDGHTLDEPATVRLLTQAVEEGLHELTLPVTMKPPEVSSATLQTLGLKELIGRATTSYTGSPDNRRHNIANGTRFLAGKLVKPASEFSVVAALGAVDGTTGYLPELVIKENRTTPEYGGGLCQVSTTLFRAALDAGLKITERRNHSYRVSYYERGVGPGLDATIYLPSPDLKFLNDTPGWILIQGSVNTTKSEVTFELYGTKDGRRSVVSKPQVSEITDPPEPIYVETHELPQGEVKQIEKPHQGAKTVVSYQVYRGDELLFEQTFRSTYKAWAARYLVGTAPVQAVVTPTPSPSPEPPPTGGPTATPSPSPSATESSTSPSPSAT